MKFTAESPTVTYETNDLCEAIEVARDFFLEEGMGSIRDNVGSTVWVNDMFSHMVFSDLHICTRCGSWNDGLYAKRWACEMCTQNGGV